MEVVFDTRTMAAGKRRQAWSDAMCEIYLQVDCQTDPDFEYAGLVREARLGEVTITDAVISPPSNPPGKQPHRPLRKGLLLPGDRAHWRGGHPPIRNVIRPAARKRISIPRQRTL